MKNKKILIILILASGIVYANSLFSGFVWSDKSLILNKQEFFHHPGNALVLLTSPDMALDDNETTPYYRPLNTLTYMLDSYIWGTGPFGYHLENVLLHVLVAVFFYMLLMEVFEDKRLAFISALLFSVYPVNAEAVNAVFNRNVILCALFSAACLICVKKSGPKWTGAALLFYLLALLSKEPAVVLPFFLFSFRFAEGRAGQERPKSRKGLVYGFLIITVLYFIVRHLVLGAFTSKAGIELSYERLKLISSVYFEHFRLMVFPFKLNANYTAGWLSFSWYKAVGAIVGIILMVYFSLAKRTPGPVRAGVLWIFWGLLPVSNIVKIPSAPVAEKYQYFIIAGFCLILGYIISGLHKRNAISGSAIVIALTIALGARTFERNFVWRDDMSLYSSMTDADPGNALAHCNLGSIYAGQGNIDTAMREFNTALSLNPGLAKVWMNLGAISSGRGLLAESERQLNMALRLDPRLAGAHVDLGVTYFREGRLSDSERELTAALAIDPDFAQAHLDLGIIFDQEGRTDEAVRQYRTAAKLDTGLLKAHLLLGKCYQKQGDLEAAAGEFQYILKLDPGNEQAMEGLDQIGNRR